MLNDFDHDLLKALLADDTRSQQQLAGVLNVTPSAIAHSLTRLARAGLVELVRVGQRQQPRLTIRTAFERFESTLSDFIGAA